MKGQTMTRFSRILAAALAVVSLALAAGCEKRPTGYDPNPNSPEGVPAVDARLLAYRNAVRCGVTTPTPIDSAGSRRRSPARRPCRCCCCSTGRQHVRALPSQWRGTSSARGLRAAGVFKYVNAGYEFSSAPTLPGSAHRHRTWRAGRGRGATPESPLSNEPWPCRMCCRSLQRRPAALRLAVHGVVGRGAALWAGSTSTEATPRRQRVLVAAGADRVHHRGRRVHRLPPREQPGRLVQFKLRGTGLLTLKYSRRCSVALLRARDRPERRRTGDRADTRQHRLAGDRPTSGSWPLHLLGRQDELLLARRRKVARRT